MPELVGKIHSMSSEGILLVSGDKGYAVYDEEFKCLCAVQSDCINKERVYFAERNHGQFNFVFGDDNKKKVLTIS